MLKPLDEEPGKTHYPAVLPSENARITDDGSTIDVRYTIVRAEVTPGDHTFHTEVSWMRAGKGPFPVLIELSGDPAPPDDQRFERTTIHLD